MYLSTVSIAYKRTSFSAESQSFFEAIMVAERLSQEAVLFKDILSIDIFEYPESFDHWHNPEMGKLIASLRILK